VKNTAVMEQQLFQTATIRQNAAQQQTLPDVSTVEEIGTAAR